MPELVADCPRCKSKKITFDLTQENYLGQSFNWQFHYEAFCICRNCNKSTVFVLAQKEAKDTLNISKYGLLKITNAVNHYMIVKDFISLKDTAAIAPPEHIPKDIEAAFNEGAKCLAIGCYNAAATMFRLCIDIGTKDLLPEDHVDGLNSKIRRNLGLRLPWLFDSKRLDESLRDLSMAVKEDGNDGAHEGTLSEHDAEDIVDFTIALLNRIYTEPERLRIATERRKTRRAE
ncbi:DUF4145 domain-containing protein [Iodobacter sp. BJB302]|uniref:DUF4145 domain-containing protein n=1 Tax=Iodobacter sp. BJB302 TaxID=1506510 RepID=UPI000C1225B9|nr:DUF4145 domain-containing protein [Iodobacter sp. BJB302]PHV02786.1 hypothetical protein CSQ88_05080 [Iodobacter sp. BJB302]